MHQLGVSGLKVTFLGTGTSQGVPVIGCECDVCTSGDKRNKRLRTSVWIEINGVSVVIDSGPDFRYQMLRAEVKRLDAIVFTHEHKDHVAGLDDIRAYNYLQESAIDIIANDDVQAALKTNFHYAFDPSITGGVPRLNIISLTDNNFELSGTTWTPLPVMHDTMKVYGFRIGDFAYLTDVNSISEDTMKKMKGLKVLVISALRKSEHPSHFSLDEVIDGVQILKPETTYLTHMSHLIGLHSDLENELPEGIHPAHDGLTLVSI